MLSSDFGYIFSSRLWFYVSSTFDLIKICLLMRDMLASAHQTDKRTQRRAVHCATGKPQFTTAYFLGGTQLIHW